VFDDLYFLGGRLHSSWALETSEGIILIDTIFPYNSEELILDGMLKVGLDPADIKYIVISHAHGDHIGGVEIVQAASGAPVVMGAADWDLVQRWSPMAGTWCAPTTAKKSSRPTSISIP
jgi:metallo-beta-lactamase class B